LYLNCPPLEAKRTRTSTRGRLDEREPIIGQKEGVFGFGGERKVDWNDVAVDVDLPIRDVTAGTLG